MLAWLQNLDNAASGVQGGAVRVTYDRRLTRQRYGGLWCLLLVLLAGCIQPPRPELVNPPCLVPDVGQVPPPCR